MGIKVESYAFYGEGIESMYRNDNYKVEIKNQEPATDRRELTYLKKYNEVDTIAVLLYGSCTINEGSEQMMDLSQKKQKYKIKGNLSQRQQVVFLYGQI